MPLCPTSEVCIRVSHQFSRRNRFCFHLLEQALSSCIHKTLWTFHLPSRQSQRLHREIFSGTLCTFIFWQTSPVFKSLLGHRFLHNGISNLSYWSLKKLSPSLATTTFRSWDHSLIFQIVKRTIAATTHQKFETIRKANYVMNKSTMWKMNKPQLPQPRVNQCI